MTAQTPTVLKTYFEQGDTPSQAQFADLIDSYVNTVQTSAQIITSDVSAAGNFDLNLGMTIGGPTGGNKGPGTINVAGGVFVNGTAISGGGAGSGTVNAGTANQLAYYPSSTNSVSGTNAVPNGTTATTQGAGDNSTKIATTAFVNSTALTLANNTTASTQSAGDNSTKVATTAFVNSTALTLANGTTASTQSAADSTTKVATTAFVHSVITTTPTPLGVGSIIQAKYTVGSPITAGSTTAASNLVGNYMQTGGGGQIHSSGDTLAGTWQALVSINDSTGTSVTLFQRTV